MGSGRKPQKPEKSVNAMAISGYRKDIEERVSPRYFEIIRRHVQAQRPDADPYALCGSNLYKQPSVMKADSKREGLALRTLVYIRLLLEQSLSELLVRMGLNR